MKRVLIPIWILVAISSLILGVLMFRGDRGSSLTSALGPEDFYNWPLDRQVATATVIARADWRVENGVYKCIVAEIIKQKPGTQFDYKIGDEFSRGNQPAKPNTNYGEGQVLFFTDAPPTLRHISVISDGRLIGLGEVRLNTIREMVGKDNRP